MDIQDEVRVLHVTTVPNTAAFMAAPIARRQAECGYKVEFSCGPGEHLDKLREYGFPVHIVPMSRRLLAFSHIVALHQLWRLMRHNRYHVVHTHSPVASFLGRVAAALARTPVVIYHMRGSWWDSPKFIERVVFTTAERIAGRWTTHIFTINSSDTDEIVERGIVPKEKVTCLHCGAGGVDLQWFDPDRITAERREELKRELGLKDPEIVVGFIGRLVREKGIFDLLEAFRRIATIFPNARLLVVGKTLASDRDQTVSTKIQQFFEKNNGISEKVVLTGFRDDIPDVIAIMDIVVLPSYREAFGMVLAEASAIARPVISTDTRGGREAVEPGVNGFLVPIGDVEALSHVLSRLISDPELRQRLGKAGRRIALERFDERVVFATIKAEYERMLQERGLPIPKPRTILARSHNGSQSKRYPGNF